MMKGAQGKSLSAYAKNAISSRLYAIPHEIIVNIAQQLNNEQKISFALSSVKIYKTLHDAKLIPVHISSTAKAELEKKFKRDEFYANRLRLFVTTKIRKQAWCAACDRLHPLRQFPRTLSSLSTPREQKLCFSAYKGGLAMLCRCRTLLSFDDVKAWIRDCRNPKRHNSYLAHNSAHFDCHDGISYTGRVIFCNPTLQIGTTGNVQLKVVQYLCQEYGISIHDLSENIRQAMVALDLVFCPHMESSDQKVINRLLSQEHGVLTAHTVHRVSCGECETVISLHPARTIPAGTRMYVDLWIEKNLGRLQNAADPVWRRHCQRN
jgi:hypothetical protein